MTCTLNRMLMAVLLSGLAMSSPVIAWIASSDLAYHRRCWDADESRDWAKNMTIPARGWLVLRRVAGKRLPQHSVERKWDGVGVQTQALSSDCPHLVDIGQRFGTMVASKAANRQCRFWRI